MARRTELVLAWGVGAALVLTHLIPWLEPTPRLLAGVLPVELAWRLAWMAAAFAYLLWFTVRIWRPQETGASEAGEREDGR